MRKLLDNPNIAVVGLYHLGSVVSICLASLNFKVIGIDSNNTIIYNLQKSQLPLYEVGLKALLNKSRKNIIFSKDFSKLKKTQLVFFTQDTETDGSGSIKKLEKLIKSSLPFLTENVTIVIMSQVPIGFHKKLQKKIKNAKPNLNFYLYHWVDTIIMTKAIERFITPERIIIGCGEIKFSYSEILEKLLKKFSCPILKMSFESAELTKAAINLYLANSVIFANTLADYAEITGGDIHQIIPALQLDKRIGKYSYLYPTLGIAGGHLERDLLMLSKIARRKNLSSGSAGFILKQNKNRIKWIEKKLNELRKTNANFRTVCIWGLSYKNNSTSVENAPSIKLVQDLSGKFKFRAYDPEAILTKSYKDLTRFTNKYEALKNSDCLLILTNWTEFNKIDLGKFNENKKLKQIIDCTGILYPIKNKLSNFDYVCMGVG